MSGLNNILRGITAVILVLFAAGSIFSCSPDTSISAAPDKENVEFRLMGITSNAVDNTQIYLFQGAGSNHGNFAQRIVSISHTEDERLKMPVPVGIWDLTLVATKDGNRMDEVMHPVAGVQRIGQKMFELKPVNGVLYSAPELLMADIEEQEIVANHSHEVAEASLSRNVALVRFVIQQPKGFDASSNDHQISIGNIPSTIDWAGRLYPNAATPATCGANRMQGTFQIDDLGGGLQRSDTVSFIVPAHRGATAADTTLCKLNVSVSLAMPGGDRYTSTTPVDIPYVPKANKILLVKLLVDGELTVNSDILPWVNEDPFDTDIANPDTQMRLSKARLDLSPFSEQITVTASSNGAPVRPDIEVDPAASSWLSYQWGAASTANILTVEGDRHNYEGVRRESDIYLVVNNFKKKIHVIQEHTATGTISAPTPVILTPVTPQVYLPVTTPPPPHAWSISYGFFDAVSHNPDRAFLPNFSINSGFRGYSGQGISIIRKSTTVDNGDYSMYCNSTFKVHNATTMETQDIEVYNIFMRADDIGITCPTATASETIVSSEIEVYGGTGRFTIEENVPWIDNAVCIQNPDVSARAERPWVLQFDALREGPSDQWTSGSIRIRNYDAPDYYIDVPVHPNLLPVFEDFEYFVFRISWTNTSRGYDADLLVGFTENNAAFDNLPVGWSVNVCSYVYPDGRWIVKGPGNAILRSNTNPNGGPTGSYNSAPTWSAQEMRDGLLLWGGDANSASGLRSESTLLNMPWMDNNPDLPRKITIELRARWYQNSYTPRPTSGVTPLTITYTAYKGGTGSTMLLSGRDFVNNNPTQNMVYQESRGIPVKMTNAQVAYGGMPTWRSNSNYDLVCTITYDRILNTATAVWKQ